MPNVQVGTRGEDAVVARILAERRAWGPIDRELVKSGPGGLRRDERKPRTAASSAVHKLKDFEERVWKEKEEKEEEEEEEAEAEDKSVGKETDDCPRRS
ncbi:hypothetical protein VTH82DRAFT_3814 [Thermothelomyces myriococcoides]